MTTALRAAPAVTRNDLPWKPYVYQGTGADVLTPELGDPFDFEAAPHSCYCDGDVAAYRQHLANGEEPCQASRDDVNLYERRRRGNRDRTVKVHLDAGGGPRCGQGTRLAGPGDDVTCRSCLSLAAGTYHLIPDDPKPCGTPAAYRRHIRRGESPCEACKQAQSRDKADRHASRERP